MGQFAGTSDDPEPAALALVVPATSTPEDNANAAIPRPRELFICLILRHAPALKTKVTAQPTHNDTPTTQNSSTKEGFTMTNDQPQIHDTDTTDFEALTREACSNLLADHHIEPQGDPMVDFAWELGESSRASQEWTYENGLTDLVHEAMMLDRTRRDSIVSTTEPERTHRG